METIRDLSNIQLILVTSLQILVVLMLVIDYFSNRKKISKINRRIEALEGFVKKIGCVKEK